MTVYLALGSNLGDRQAYLSAAIAGLSRRGVQITRSGSLYSTEPHNMPGQAWFLNTVVEANTLLTPEQLLERCLAVEKENFRKRAGKNQPRTLDIDIIFYGRRIVREAGLSIPHPQFRNRRFVLEPLAEIAPDFVDPVSGKTVRVLLQDVHDSRGISRVAPPLL